MASLLPGTIVFCGHNKSNVSILMRRLVEHLIDRPQASEDAEELSVQIYLGSPNPLWTTMMEGRGAYKCVRYIIDGIDRSYSDMLPQLKMRLNSDARPANHMIVVLDGVDADYAAKIDWGFLMRNAYNYNVSFLVHSCIAPILSYRPPSSGFYKGDANEDAARKYRIDDQCTAAVLAWDASDLARENNWKVFGMSFGPREEFEKHYQKLTTEVVAAGPGGAAMIIEYRGVSNFAYTCGIPQSVTTKK